MRPLIVPVVLKDSCHCGAKTAFTLSAEPGVARQGLRGMGQQPELMAGAQGSSDLCTLRSMVAAPPLQTESVKCPPLLLYLMDSVLRGGPRLSHGQQR